MTEPTTVSALRVMERNDLIHRNRDKEDTRKVIVKLTRKGRSLKKKLLHLVPEVNEHILEGYSQKEIEKLKKTIRSLTSRMEK